MQSMGSMEVDPPINVNTQLARILISESNDKHFKHTNGPIPNIIIDDIGDITLELGVGMCMITNTNAPQVIDRSASNPKATKPRKSIEGDSNFNHTNQLVPMVSKTPNTQTSFGVKSSCCGNIHESTSTTY